ncbi:hypothetical protein [Streptomyces sp. NPDC088258]|uniref:hypothetical protein n=1 Tax=Streptomyces sp. NPDC088258 TaxID=3365849 RepID=UPI00382FFE9C
MPGWSYSFVAALTPDRISWTRILDVVRLGPADDAAAVTPPRLLDSFRVGVPADGGPRPLRGPATVDTDEDDER